MKAEELNKLEKLIDEYRITKNGIMVCVPNPKKISRDILEELKSHKQDILDILNERETADIREHEIAKHKEEKFLASVQGYNELNKARDDWSIWKEQFEMAFESGSGIYPVAPFDESYLIKLEQEYPDAVFVSKVYQERYCANYEITSIAKEIYKKMIDGMGIKDAKTEYENEKKAFVQRHIWD